VARKTARLVEQVKAAEWQQSPRTDGELTAGVRKSETVTLRDPVMPVTDGFSG
jgi:hypothetical protein